MKKNFMLAAVLSLFLFALSAAAQDKAVNFTGTWNLDVSKSSLGDRNMIESQTLTVTQTDKDIKIETATKRPPMTQGGGNGGMKGGHMGGPFGGGDGTSTFTLDGKETKSEISTPMGSTPVTMKANIESGKLKISRSSSFSGPMGEVTISSKEIWTLSSDGSTLTVNVERSTPRGNETTTKVFTKKV